MWIFTKHGFYSVVQDKEDPDMMIVRARLKEHIDRLLPYLQRVPGYEDCKVLGVETTPQVDYRYRTNIEQDVWALMVAEMTQDIDYPNFKAQVFAEEGKSNYEAALHGVWNEMRWMQDQEPRPVLVKAKKATKKRAPRKAKKSP